MSVPSHVVAAAAPLVARLAEVRAQDEGFSSTGSMQVRTADLVALLDAITSDKRCPFGWDGGDDVGRDEPCPVCGIMEDGDLSLCMELGPKLGDER